MLLKIGEMLVLVVQLFQIDLLFETIEFPQCFL